MNYVIEKLSEKDVVLLNVLAGIFAASIVVANLAAGVKLECFLGFIVPAGTVAYAFTFPITDIVDEIYGKRRAVYIVWAGLAAELIMLVLLGIDYLIPALEPEMQTLYERVFGMQVRIVAASIVAYIVSQHHDVWAFWFWRRITKGKYLWMRNNASTIVSQFIDSAIFTTIAFGDIVSIAELLNMVISMWLFKVIIAVMDTPFVYLGVWFCRKVTSSLRLGIISNAGNSS